MKITFYCNLQKFMPQKFPAQWYVTVMLTQISIYYNTKPFKINWLNIFDSASMLENKENDIASNCYKWS
jgi:hypothetical protein